ncbi:BatB protein, partial [Pseudomonadales bacterium]|nr:BatB protein [Pseudomonadales bacterium]
IGIGSEKTTRGGIFGRSLRRNLSADLDEETLTLIAEQSGGRYFRATSPEQLEAIYAELDLLEPVEQNEQSFRPVKELFYWPLSLALAAILALLLPNLRLSAQHSGQSKP